MPASKTDQFLERRNSDSDFVLDRRSSIEKVNLAEEIKKLSARLMMLSSMSKTDLIDLNENIINDRNPEEMEQPFGANSSDSVAKPNESQKPNKTPTEDQPPSSIATKEPSTTRLEDNKEEVLHKKETITKPVIKEKPEFLKNLTRSNMQEIFTKSINSNEDFIKTSNFQTTRTFTRASSVAHDSRTFTENVFGNKFENFGVLSRINRGALFDRLKLLEDMPTLQPKLNKMHNTFESITTQKQTQSSPNIESSSTKPNNLPWINHQTSTRRTKFRVSQSSRDVPIGSPDTHQKILLDESVTATKDCLLNLLDKYSNSGCSQVLSQNGRQSNRTECRVKIDVGEQQRSTNSLNFFFQRHATMGTTVKQMQAQLESKKKP